MKQPLVPVFIVFWSLGVSNLGAAPLQLNTSRSVDDLDGVRLNTVVMEKLTDEILLNLENYYVGFYQGAVDWPKAKEELRRDLVGIKTHGRFFQRLSKLFRSFRDGHTTLTSRALCGNPADSFDTHAPIFHFFVARNRLGACVFPNDEGLTVYKVAP